MTHAHNTCTKILSTNRRCHERFIVQYNHMYKPNAGVNDKTKSKKPKKPLKKSRMWRLTQCLQQDTKTYCLEAF